MPNETSGKTIEEQLTGMALDQAVVRVVWTGAFSQDDLSPLWGKCFCVWNHHSSSDEITEKVIGNGATEPEAWEDAARKVVEAEGYYFRNVGDLWWWNNRDYGGPANFPTRALALESAKRDYIVRNRTAARLFPAPEKANQHCSGDIVQQIRDFAYRWLAESPEERDEPFGRILWASNAINAALTGLRPVEEAAFNMRGAYRMAQAISNLVHLGRLDARSEASDAMLDYMGERGVPAPTVNSIFAKPQPLAEDGVQAEVPSPYPFDFSNEQILAAVQDTEYAKGHIAHHLQLMTSNERMALYRAVSALTQVKLTSELAEARNSIAHLEVR